MSLMRSRKFTGNKMVLDYVTVGEIFDGGTPIETVRGGKRAEGP